jgi:hypothetical protein
MKPTIVALPVSQPQAAADLILEAALPTAARQTHHSQRS